MYKKIKLILLENNPDDVTAIRRLLQSHIPIIEVLSAEDEASYIGALTTHSPDIIVASHQLSSINTAQAIHIMHQNGYSLPFIVVSANPSLQAAIAILKLGADDYILKSNMAALPDAISAAIEKKRLKNDTIRDLSLYFNTTDEVYFSRDPVNSVLFEISPGCESVYGYKAAEFLADPELYAAIYHPDDLHILKNSHHKLWQGERVISKYRIIHKDKSIRWIESKIIPQLNSEGELIRIDGVSRDITKTQHAEEQLKLSEQRFRDLLENSGDMLLISNFKGDITYLSPNIAKILGYHINDFGQIDIGRNFVHPENQKAYYTIFFEAQQNAGKNLPFSGRVKHAQGHWVWIEGTVTNLLHLPGVKGIVSNFRDVTARKTAEDNMYRSEQRYRQFVETAQEGILVIDKDGVILFANKKMCEMLEYNADEIIGRYNYDFKNEHEVAKTLARNESRRLGKSETHESSFITKSGKNITFSVVTNGLFDADEHYVGTLAMMTDITQRKVDENALKNSEANLSAIIENTSDLVYSLDKNLRFITFNKIFKNTIRNVYSFEVEQGGNPLDMLAGFDPEVAKKWHEIYLKALAGETIQFVNEYPFAGNSIYLSYSINPIRENDTVIGLSCFSRDITQQKTDEIALKKSEASLRTIFNNTELAFLLIDTDLKIASFNDLAQTFSKEQNTKALVDNASIFDYFSDDRHDYIRNVLNRVKAGQTVNYQLNRTVNGTEKWFDISWAGIKHPEHDNFGYLLTNREITEKKKLELEREKITADLIQRNKDLEQFTYIISHNLRAPVANILGLSALLSTMDAGEAEFGEMVTGIDISARKLDEVIGDLNQILQVNSYLNEKVEEVSLSLLVDDIKNSINHLMEKEHARIHYDFAAADTIFTFKSYLYSIFYNLILNSIKYRQSKKTPVITIDTKIEDQKIKFMYHDNGRGIDTVKNADHLFGLYKRFDTSVEGKGMGLFMVKMQVESLGGKITMYSKINEGTSFELEFPIAHFREHSAEQ